MWGQAGRSLGRIAAVSLVALLAACASKPPSVTTTANKSEAYARKLQRVVLVDAFRRSLLILEKLKANGLI